LKPSKFQKHFILEFLISLFGDISPIKKDKWWQVLDGYLTYIRRPLVPIRHIKYCKSFQFLSCLSWKGLIQIPLWIDGMVPNPNFCTMMIFLPIAYYGLICFFLKYSKSKLKPKKNVPWIQWAIMSSQTSHLDNQADENFSFYLYMLHTCFKCMTFVCKKYMNL